MTALTHARDTRLARSLTLAADRAANTRTVVVEGVLKRVVGLTLEAVGCQSQIGSRCRVVNADGGMLEAEVVGFSGDRTYLMPTGEMVGLKPNARVIPMQRMPRVPVGDGLLGRVLDSEGEPLDGLGHLVCDRKPAINTPINPLARAPIKEPLDVGVRAINALLTVGRGQRLGLFAGTGVGKSTLLGMMTRYTQADVIVVGLVGERGREVRDFIDNALGPEALKRAVVVATPADRSPLARVRGAWLATNIAEAFRDQGKNVLLLMDSLSRYAQALREIGLAVGEPPATRGYPPSVFAQLPKLVERAGIDPKSLEDVVLGTAYPEAQQGSNIARLASLLAGLPLELGGITMNRFCGSSMSAIHYAAGQIAIGAGEAFIAGGVESMTRVPQGGFNHSPNPRFKGKAQNNPDVMLDAYISMGETAENVAKECGIGREESDAVEPRLVRVVHSISHRHRLLRARTRRRRPDRCGSLTRRRPRWSLWWGPSGEHRARVARSPRRPVP